MAPNPPPWNDASYWRKQYEEVKLAHERYQGDAEQALRELVTSERDLKRRLEAETELRLRWERRMLLLEQRIQDAGEALGFLK